jgi:hypothetical protein
MGMHFPLGLTARRAHVFWGRPFRITGLTKVLVGLLLLGLLVHSGPAFSTTLPTGQSVTLA